MLWWAGRERLALSTTCPRLAPPRVTWRARAPPLQVILMSATLDAAMFAAYFDAAAGAGGVPTLTAGGRTFPVQQVGSGIDSNRSSAAQSPQT